MHKKLFEFEIKATLTCLSKTQQNICQTNKYSPTAGGAVRVHLNRSETRITHILEEGGQETNVHAPAP